jgi:hypothetical protein
MAISAVDILDPAAAAAAEIEEPQINGMMMAYDKFMGLADKIKYDLDVMAVLSRETTERMRLNTEALQDLDAQVGPQPGWPAPLGPQPTPAQTLAYDQAAYAATRDIESRGGTLGAYYNRYRVATTINGATTYTYSDRTAVPPIDNSNPNLQESGFVVNPTPAQLLSFRGQLTDPTLENLSEILFIAGANVQRAGANNTVKFAWGPDNTPGYAALPVKEVADPVNEAALGLHGGELIRKTGTNDYFYIQGATAYQVTSPLPAPVLVQSSADFPSQTPGSVVMIEDPASPPANPTYQYFRIRADGTGVRTSYPLLEFVAMPDKLQLEDWREQLTQLNITLSTTSSNQQIFMQEKLAMFSSYLSFASNVLADYFRTINTLTRY